MIATAGKIDYKEQLRELYRAPRTPVLVDAPELQFLMIDGAGDPNTAPAYRDAVEALVGLSYAIKFGLRRLPDGLDYIVMPLEGLWWSDDPAGYSDDKDSWRWTLMIMQPEQVTDEKLAEAVARARARSTGAVPRG